MQNRRREPDGNLFALLNLYAEELIRDSAETDAPRHRNRFARQMDVPREAHPCERVQAGGGFDCAKANRNPATKTAGRCSNVVTPRPLNRVLQSDFRLGARRTWGRRMLTAGAASDGRCGCLRRVKPRENEILYPRLVLARSARPPSHRRPNPEKATTPGSGTTAGPASVTMSR